MKHSAIRPHLLCAEHSAAAVVIMPQRFEALLKPRPRAAHKGDFGHLLVIGGARGKSGAPALAGLAALRTGAGLVSVAAPESIIAQIAAIAPELMTIPLPEDADGAVGRGAFSALLPALAHADAVVCGMGLGTGAGAKALLSALGKAVAVPAALDADALNLQGENLAALARWASPLLLTPHSGEAGRLLGVSRAQIERGRADSARQLSAGGNAVVILKGKNSLISSPGGTLLRNPTGNPGMATAGSGDVLSGIAGALLARGIAPVEAAALAAYWHGLAGDLAAEELTEEGLIAGDLIRFLPAALKKMRAQR